MYIPSPPDEDVKEKAGEDVAKPEAAHISGNNVEHTYPPKQPTKRRFQIIRRMSSKAFSSSGSSTLKNEKGGEANESPENWEDCWEQGEFPFVRLTENRASCAICLLDFEEPKRRVAREVIKSWAKRNGRSDLVADASKEAGETNSPQDSSTAGPSTSPTAPQQDVREVPIASPVSEQSELKLEDAGEGAQPLRLLECGHVFHVS